jgi:hypothetical protein
MNPNTASEYRNLPLNVLSESTTNPRHIFEDAALKELADSIRTQGILSPLLVRPLADTEIGSFAGPRTRVVEEQQQCIVALSLYGRSVRHGKQSLHFYLFKVRHELPYRLLERKPTSICRSRLTICSAVCFFPRAMFRSF